MMQWHPYQKKEHPPKSKVAWRLVIGMSGLLCLVLIGILDERVSWAATKKGARKVLNLQPSMLVPGPSAVETPETAIDDGACQNQNNSLIATLIPDDSSDRRLLCAINGKDLIHRFVKVQDFPRDQILLDYKSKIGEEFQIPSNLVKRVGFWFDVYTKYPSYIKIIHHAKYPWIEYHRYNLTNFLVKPKIQWMNMAAAEKYVAAEKNRWAKLLKRLEKRQNFDDLSEDEQFLVDALADVPGSRAKVYREAAQSVRVQTGQMDFYVEGLMRKSQYLETMDEIFEQAGLPTELTRLPLVESSFNVDASSKVGAAGIWQFMASTGRTIMKVNDSVDERRSPIKSTIAAARYLKSTHRMLYYNWPLTIVAYNHGPGGVRKAVRVANSFDVGTVISKYESRSFSFATKNYYPEFLAALYAERYQTEIFGPLQTLPKINFEVVKLNRSFRPVQLAKQLGLPLDVFLGYNRDLKPSIIHNRSLPVGLTIYLPPGYADALSVAQPVKTLALSKAKKFRDSETENE